MANVRPFAAIRPAKEKAKNIAALPYDVYNTQEARQAIEDEPYSFLRIDRAETQFEEGHDMYAPDVYQKAHDLLWEMVDEGDFIRDEKPCYYIYELTMRGRSQTGIAACVSIDDYLNNVVKKHENTIYDKEIDRINHVNICNAQTGPIFLAYRDSGTIDNVVEAVKGQKPEYDFLADDNVRHRVWIVSSKAQIKAIKSAFERIDSIYIADGHHRAGSAVHVGQLRREKNPGYTGDEEFNYFLAVLFPDSELEIMDYNRVVKDLNGLSPEEFLDAVSEVFDVECLGTELAYPAGPGIFNMYLEGKWYSCEIRPEDRSNDPVEGLDVSILQNKLLAPILGIKDPKADKRIAFVGGIRGLTELERRCSKDAKAAFAMYPTSISQLFAVSDSGLLMPPKSTWFEPKLRSGLFIHEI